MRTFSNTFRENLREIRQLQGIVTYFVKNGYYVLTTENNNNIATEINDLLITQKGPVEILQNKINKINPLYNVDLLRTVCKIFEINTTENIPIGTKINVKIGVKVNDDYEYMDYGNYYVRNNVYQADTNSYLITCYDKMYESMIDYDENPIDITFPISIKNLLIKICDKFNWEYNFDNIINGDKELDKDLFKNLNLTYRDILDNISEVVAGNLLFNLNDVLTVKYINPTSEDDVSIDENDLKNKNVNIKEKYGPVNSLLITTNDNVVLNNLNDESSINENGKCELQIDDNYILINNSDDFINDIFEQLKGLEYYIYDIETIGLLIFEPLDRYNIKIGDNKYSTLMLNDDIQLTSGLLENCYADMPEIAKTEYISQTKNEKKLNNALISLDKANAEIQLKVNKGDVVSEINLSPEVVELKGNRVVINSTYFKVSEDGKIIATSGDIGGFVLTTESFKKNLDGIYNYNNFDLVTIAAGIMELVNIDNNLELILDYNNDGVISSVDYANIKFIINGKIENTKNVKGKFEINSKDPKNCVSIKDENDNSIVSLGVGGINSSYGTFNNVIIGYPTDNFAESTIITMNGDTGNIRCVSLTQTSLKESKKNFEKYNGALEEIKNIDIYKYNLKNENDEDKKHLGFVIGEDFNYSQLITSSKNDGVDNYSFTSLCLQAIKEQQVQIENLQNQINELKEMINNG